MMDERIFKYFQDELTGADKLSFLREVESNEALKKEFIDYKNTQVLAGLSAELTDRQEGKKGFTRFLLLRSRLRRRLFAVNTMKYAAAVAILMVATYYVSVNFIQPTELLTAETNTLHVPAGQRARLSLHDGTSVWLNAQSTLTYPSHFVGKERRVSISGEAYFDVARNEEKPFIVTASDAEIKVLGTQFNVYSYPDAGFVQTSLLQGSVSIAPTGSTAKPILLKPNQQATLREGRLTVEEIQFHDAFLWKDGIYSFDNERLEDIARKLELYYDVKIVIGTPELANVRYTCKFRQRDGIDEILKIISRIHKFSIEKNKEKNVTTLS